MSFLNPRSSKSSVCSTRYEGPALAPPLCLLVGNRSGRRGKGNELGFQLGLKGGSSTSSFSYFCGDCAMGGLYIFPGRSRAGHLRVVEAGSEPRVGAACNVGLPGAWGSNLLPLLQVLERSPYLLCRGLARAGVNRRLGVQRRMSVAESLFQSKACKTKKKSF